ncbi:helix-turn-helix domain-containing protein [Novosphingobium sp. Leaf2]|uniref:helix-turn-helix domain-containing protein n=1 Tax=Novosphingobium sp. Leaf2 TaxID=1735670 RepID=UPI0006F81785|nr:helix-turn-helix domain-containing protein [Novosphingobium sp. Leaf2]KQM19508.1 hypothetical protein ASE49_04590 [Novosphingobium sp. Leaf2]
MENLETQGLGQSTQSAGSQLRAAREAAGKTCADIATETKIAERHLHALEEDRLGDLAARTYAVGFARTYARAVGLDERVIAAKVREQLDGQQAERPKPAPSFEPGDPARVPTRRLAWGAAAGVVVAVIILLTFWSSFLSPQGSLPELVSRETAKPAAPARGPGSGATPAQASGGPVVLTATGDNVWVKVTDGAGQQVLQNELAKGESWTVPANIPGLQLRTGRPDALQIAVGGKPIAPLSTEPRLVTGVSLAAADLLARANPAAAPGASSTPSASPTPAAPSARPVPRAAQPAARPASRAVRPTPVPTPESLLPPSVSTPSD